MFVCTISGIEQPLALIAGLLRGLGYSASDNGKKKQDYKKSNYCPKYLIPGAMIYV